MREDEYDERQYRMKFFLVMGVLVIVAGLIMMQVCVPVMRFADHLIIPVGK